MPDWQERITRETTPALRTEHDLRYRLAAPLVRAAAGWCDLGCGNGVAAADAFAAGLPPKAVLVDVAPDAVAAAEAELGAAGTGQIDAFAADLTAPEDLARVRAALLAISGERVVTCFEVVEHLATFVPLIELLSELASTGEATVLLSVPNDAFWGTENPHHLTMWGEGAFEELRGLLPAGARVVRQVALSGSALVPVDDGEVPEVTVSVAVRASEAVPTHFLVAMGPAAERVGVVAGVDQVDLDGQRAWEREREAHLAYSQQLVREWTPWFDEWRAYIHDLEKRLGLPPSGVDPEQLPSGAPVAAADEPAPS